MPFNYAQLLSLVWWFDGTNLKAQVFKGYSIHVLNKCQKSFYISNCIETAWSNCMGTKSYYVSIYPQETKDLQRQELVTSVVIGIPEHNSQLIVQLFLYLDIATWELELRLDWNWMLWNWKIRIEMKLGVCEIKKMGLHWGWWSSWEVDDRWGRTGEGRTEGEVGLYVISPHQMVIFQLFFKWRSKIILKTKGWSFVKISQFGFCERIVFLFSCFYFLFLLL